MATKAKFQTKGFDKYFEALAAADRDIDAAADKALMAAGQVLLGGMKERVPKDTHNLESHLAIEGPIVDGNFHYIEVGIEKGADAETARYANAQEYGSTSMAAQPYIRPTLDKDKKKARAAVRKSLKEDGKI